MLLYFLFHGSYWEKFPHIILKPRVIIGHHAELLLSGVTADTSTISWKFIPEEEEVVNREEGPQIQKSEQWWEAPESFHQVHKPWSTGAAAENRCAQRAECARGISALKLHSISRSISDLQGSYHFQCFPVCFPSFNRTIMGSFFSLQK